MDLALFDINGDMGEWSDAGGAARERAIMPFLTSCNIACGAHAGDEEVMDRTLRLALEHGVSPGAHPSYPDRAGFGRVRLDISLKNLESAIREQLEALARVADALGAGLTHMKPHGALYHEAAGNGEIAQTLAELLRSFDPGLALVGPPGSQAERAARDAGIAFRGEAFADRAYEDDLSLRSRGLPGALLSDPALAVGQVRDMVERGGVRTASGLWRTLRAETVCIHSDTPGADAIARAVFDYREGHVRRVRS